MVLINRHPRHRLQLKQFGHAEKERNFYSGGFGCVRPMHRISLDVLGEAFANGTFRRICGVRGAHHVAPMLDRVVALQHQNDHGTLRHKNHQALEERPFAMDVVEALGLLLGKPDHFHPADPESSLFDHAEDLASMAVRDGVGFYYCEGLLNWHCAKDGS
jgi:hypothetical protein